MSAKRGRRRPLFLFVGAAAGFVAAQAALRLGPMLVDLDAVEVHGTSMVPTLNPGERLLVEASTFRRRSPRPGELVLAADPRAGERELIKRVAKVRDGRVELRGDATESTDSRTFGALPIHEIRWRVLVRYWPPSRIGAVR